MAILVDTKSNNTPAEPTPRKGHGRKIAAFLFLVFGIVLLAVSLTVFPSDGPAPSTSSSTSEVTSSASDVDGTTVDKEASSGTSVEDTSAVDDVTFDATADETDGDNAEPNDANTAETPTTTDTVVVADYPTAWPELVGTLASYAQETIRDENPFIETIEVIPRDEFVTMDYYENRVRIFIFTENLTVSSTPMVG